MKKVKTKELMLKAVRLMQLLVMMYTESKNWAVFVLDLDLV